MVPVAARRRGRALGGVRPSAGARVGFQGSSARRSTCRRCRSREARVAPSRRARSSGAHGSRGATVARNRSCRRRKRSGRLVWAFSQAALSAFNERPARESSPTNLSETSSPQPRARPHARHGDAPLTALRLSGAMGGSRNSGRRVGGGGLGSVRPRPFRAPRCRHGTSAAAAAWISRKRASPPDTLAADVPPPRPRTRFPRMSTRRVSRARLPATARTSAATTGDTSSRATTATSRISTPTARDVRICAR